MADEKINTEGGGVVKGDVDTGGGDFAGRDKITTTSHTNRTETTFTTNLSGNVLVTIVAVLMLGIITVLAVFRDKSLESPINQSVGIVSTTSNQEKQVASISPSTAEPIQTLAEATSVKVDPSTAHQAAPTSVPTLIQQTVSIATPLSKSSSAKLPSPSDSDILGKAVKGKIETPGARDTYTFTAEAGQTLYFDVQAYHDSNGNTYGSSTAKPALYMELYPEGESTRIFSKPLYGDVGRYTLPKTGKYLISIGNQNNDVTGTYMFQVWNAPSDQFEIAIGDQISENKPGQGAGKIETPGARDTYTFTAEAGQTLYFDVQAYHDSNGNTYGSSIAKPALYMELYPEGESRWILSKPLYGDVGRYTLPKTGKYLISIGNQNNDVTGTYSFRIKNVK